MISSGKYGTKLREEEEEELRCAMFIVRGNLANAIL